MDQIKKLQKLRNFKGDNSTIKENMKFFYQIFSISHHQCGSLGALSHLFTLQENHLH